MFQFRRFPSCFYLIQSMIHAYCTCVFPHSEISGSSLICSSPKLIAACHVLHRLLMPRHSPCALFSLTFLEQPPVQYLVLLNYAGSTRSFRNCFTLNLLKFSTICFLNHAHYCTCFPLLPCFLFSSIQFSRCKLEAFASWWRIAGSNR